MTELQLARRLALAALAAIGLLAGGTAAAVESDPLPLPADGARAQAVSAYNEGVRLLVARRFGDAQQQFERALALDDLLAEAHNNLAFALRMQSRDNFSRSLFHYGRALEIKPGLAQAYMYRGVLYAQMGDLARARADHEKLLALDAGLAGKLQQAIEGRGEDPRAGVSGQYD